MANIRVSISVTTGTYGDNTLASVDLTVPVDSDRDPSPADIDVLEEQLGTRIAQVRRELAAQIAAKRAKAEAA